MIEEDKEKRNKYSLYYWLEDVRKRNWWIVMAAIIGFTWFVMTNRKEILGYYQDIVRFFNDNNYTKVESSSEDEYFWKYMDGM